MEASPEIVANETPQMIPAKDWLKLCSRMTAGIYKLNDGETVTYIGRSKAKEFRSNNVHYRVAQELTSWDSSEIYRKCAPPNQVAACYKLIERWQIALVATEIDNDTKRGRRRNAPDRGTSADF
jgi:hypothetical protein